METITMNDDKRKQSARAMVILYPIGVLAVALLLNTYVFGVKPLVLSLLSVELLSTYVGAAVLLVINHTWLMTSTELTRIRYSMYATPEEWVASGKRPADVSEEGVRELSRRHNAHRNTTENSVYFVLLALILSCVTPTVLMAQCWILGFPVMRLGYTFSYLAGNDNLRGLFMTLSLMAIYGLAGYLVLALFTGGQR